MIAATYLPQAPFPLCLQGVSLGVSGAAWQPPCIPNEYQNLNILLSYPPTNHKEAPPHQVLQAGAPQTWLFVLQVQAEAQESKLPWSMENSIDEINACKI